MIQKVKFIMHQEHHNGYIKKISNFQSHKGMLSAPVMLITSNADNVENQQDGNDTEILVVF